MQSVKSVKSNHGLLIKIWTKIWERKQFDTSIYTLSIQTFKRLFARDRMQQLDVYTKATHDMTGEYFGNGNGIIWKYQEPDEMKARETDSHQSTLGCCNLKWSVRSLSVTLHFVSYLSSSQYF